MSDKHERLTRTWHVLARCLVLAIGAAILALGIMQLRATLGDAPTLGNWILTIIFCGGGVGVVILGIWQRWSNLKETLISLGSLFP
jgi:hypothetical protein